jgi:hypothetical protein
MSYHARNARRYQADRHALLPHSPTVFAIKRNFFARPGRCAPFAVNGLLALVTAATASAQVPASRPSPPPPDVYIASITPQRGAATVGAPMNITDRPGYDNQPSFSGDQRGVFFTSVRDDAQADIYRYDLGTKRTTRVTTTAPESEYSATPSMAVVPFQSYASSATRLNDSGGSRWMAARRRSFSNASDRSAIMRGLMTTPSRCSCLARQTHCNSLTREPANRTRSRRTSADRFTEFPARTA